MTQDKELTIIGRAEMIDLLDYNIAGVPAKIDTGADSSSLWVSDVMENEAGLTFKLFGPGSEFYTNEVVSLHRWQYTLTRVANSFGQRELRYKVKIRIKVSERVIRATFTLSDRSQKTYPVLLGRRLLHGKFLVNVSEGDPLGMQERQKTKALEQEISKLRGNK